MQSSERKVQNESDRLKAGQRTETVSDFEQKDAKDAKERKSESRDLASYDFRKEKSGAEAPPQKRFHKFRASISASFVAWHRWLASQARHKLGAQLMGSRDAKGGLGHRSLRIYSAGASRYCIRRTRNLNRRIC